jgi:putative membrane protein
MLRGQDPWADPEVLAAFTRFEGGEEELESLRGQSNLTHALLHLQQRSLAELGERGELTELRLQSLDRTIAALLDIQGGCERIKKTPFPKGYGFIADRLIWAYSFIFPLVIAENLGWAAVPINLLVCMALALISEVGRVLEDPFSLFWNGLPLSAISRMIEVNLRERLGQSEGLPPLLKPNARGILM